MTISKRLVPLLLLFSAFVAAQDTIQSHQLVEMHEGASSTKDFKYYYKNEPFTGVVLDRYADGQKSWFSTYKDGFKNGPEIAWWENGNKSYEIHYKAGIPTGEIKNWHSNGHLHSMGKVSEVTQDDIVIIDKNDYAQYDEYKYDLKEVLDQDYLRTGQWTFYHKDGSISARGNYLPLVVVEYETTLQYDIKGNLVEAATRSVRQGTKDGTWKYYNLSGRLIMEEIYENYRLVEGKEYDFE